jgi:hypothetical protein
MPFGNGIVMNFANTPRITAVNKMGETASTHRLFSPRANAKARMRSGSRE